MAFAAGRAEMRGDKMYKAPVEDIAFTLKHVVGLKPALEDAVRDHSAL